MWHRSSTSKSHSAVLPHLRRSETSDMAQSGECPQEALGTGGDTVADCELSVSHRAENLAWMGTLKKKKKKCDDRQLIITVWHQFEWSWLVKGQSYAKKHTFVRTCSHKFLCNRYTKLYSLITAQWPWPYSSSQGYEKARTCAVILV